jgi:hypothetical protein
MDIYDYIRAHGKRVGCFVTATRKQKRIDWPRLPAIYVQYLLESLKPARCKCEFFYISYYTHTPSDPPYQPLYILLFLSSSLASPTQSAASSSTSSIDSFRSTFWLFVSSFAFPT